MSKVCLLGLNFYPEDTAIGLYSYQMVEHLSRSGWKASVVTGFPYYPRWSVFPEYAHLRGFIKEKTGEIDIFRYRQYIPQSPTLFKRLIHLLDFTFGSAFNLLRVGSTDVVICIVPFTGSVLLGWLLARANRAALWVHIQDFEVDAMFESGLSSDRGFVGRVAHGFLSWFERWLFNRADVVSTISYGMVSKLEEKTSRNAYFFPNWVNGEDINPEEASMHKIFKSREEDFKVLYSGNIGEKQDWGFFIRLVDLLSRKKGVTFYIVGAGAKAVDLKEKLAGKGNVVFSDPVPYSELGDLLCSADLHILLQKASVIDTVMPSKILGMMASAVPSLITGNKQSEVSSVIVESQGVGFFEPDSLSECASFIGEMQHDPELRALIGRRAREYVLANFDVKAVLSNFEHKMSDLAGSKITR